MSDPTSKTTIPWWLRAYCWVIWKLSGGRVWFTTPAYRAKTNARRWSAKTDGY